MRGSKWSPGQILGHHTWTAPHGEALEAFPWKKEGVQLCVWHSKWKTCTLRFLMQHRAATSPHAPQCGLAKLALSDFDAAPGCRKISISPSSCGTAVPHQNLKAQVLLLRPQRCHNSWNSWIGAGEFFLALWWVPAVTGLFTTDNTGNRPPCLKPAADLIWSSFTDAGTWRIDLLYQILYRSRWQNIARKGRNGRPAPCRPFCQFFHIRAIFCHRER